MPNFEQQRQYFHTGATRPVEFRIRQLKTLYQTILQQENAIYEALERDLSKSREESYVTEVGMVLSEITYAIRNCKEWSKPFAVESQLSQFYSQSTVYPEPLGVCLIISPWNYPILLAFGPLVAALAAGNCVTIKPSEYAPSVSKVIFQIIDACFETRYCNVVEGGVDTATHQLSHPYDHIFFTGSTEVGKTVMEKAAAHLTPVTLELGGKSPCIVDQSANIPLAAKRIAWGKGLNAGQTCVAPDYLLVQKGVRDQLVAELGRCFEAFYGKHPQDNPAYPRIVNQRHFDRLMALLEQGTVLAGGEWNGETMKIAPTLLTPRSLENSLMTEEIFGPLLPILEFDNLEEALCFVKGRPKPLALYLFSENRESQKTVMEQLSFGGGCINDTVSHLVSHTLPFGGVGQSGMGSYHGKWGFDTYTHHKAVLKKGTAFDLPQRYPPLDGKLSTLKRFLH